MFSCMVLNVIGHILVGVVATYILGAVFLDEMIVWSD